MSLVSANMYKLSQISHCLLLVLIKGLPVDASWLGLKVRQCFVPVPAAPVGARNANVKHHVMLGDCV